MNNLKIAMLSFADINNYGDILFSHVFKMEIEKRLPSVSIDFYTPSTIELEGFRYDGYLRNKLDGKYDAIFLAGGEVVHLFDERTWMPIYEKQNKQVISKNASDIVWDWVDCESKFKAWLSVGVRPFGDKWNEGKIEHAIKSLDFVACRGILSKKILEGSDFEKFNLSVTLTPDLGWIFPQYLDYLNLRGQVYHQYVRAESKYLLFQVHNITDEEAKLLADELLYVKKSYDLDIVLMPVIHLWKDENYLSKIDEFAGGAFHLLKNDLTVIEMLDIIVHSQIAITSSLHVAITALADGIPASVFNKWQGSKLQDLFGLQFRTDYLFNDFVHFRRVTEKLIHEKEKSSALKVYADFMQQKLCEVFDDIAVKLEKLAD